MQTEKRQWIAVFSHSSAVWTVALILIHQTIIASSSYFLTRLIEAFQQGRDYHAFLLLYLAAMLVPYIPGCASFITLQAWINSSHRRLTDRLAKSAYGLIEKHREGALREVVESVTARNSFIVIKDYLTLIHDFLGFLLNSLLSIIVLGFLLPGNLVGGYVISIVFCSSLIIVTRKIISSRSTAMEAEFVSYSGVLSGIWDNATLGNKYNFDRWSEERKVSADRYYRASNQLQVFKQSGNILLAACALGPTIYLVLRAATDNSTAPALIAAIIVNLTRIFHILNSLSSLVYQLLDWSSMNARLGIIFDPEYRLREASSLPDKIFGDLRMNGAEVKSFSEVASLIARENRGRFTIKGRNGSGKSTLLHILKKVLSEKAILIPAHHGKLQWATDGRNLSTGQRTLSQLHEVSRQTDISYLLLDEWDANLDMANTHDINQLLDQLSLERVVVEIRH